MENKITIDMLTENGCSIITEKILTLEGKKYSLGLSRVAYANSPKDRELLKNTLDKKYIEAIFSIWGDFPTQADPINYGRES